MSERHAVSPEQRLFLKERADAMANAVPPNMVDGLRFMLEASRQSGLSREDAYASVTEALRAFQKRHRLHTKPWLVLEAGCLWLERERRKGDATS